MATPPSDSLSTKAFNNALRFLKYRSRSRLEIKIYLKGKGFSLETIQSVLSRLESIGVVNDSEFAKLWIENRKRFKPKGAYALTVELRGKGISDEIIESVLLNNSEIDDSRNAVLSKLSRWQHLEKEQFQKKAFNFLRSRGFSYSICRETTEWAFEQVKNSSPGNIQ